jgi:Lon protease-like protein
MHEELLPLFPLSVVLLPGNRLPLHIFEDRYKEMIGIILQTRGEFGVVMAADGGIAQIGCTAALERVAREYEDGRLDIETVGRRRFSIVSLDEEKSYLRAAVDFFDDEGPEGAAELRRQAIQACAGFASVPEVDERHPYLSFQLAAPIEDLSFRQTMLQSRSEHDRLRRLIAFAPSYALAQDRRERLRAVAPLNGHSALGHPGKDS